MDSLEKTCEDIEALRATYVLAKDAKREAIRKELIANSANCEWFSGRYIALGILGYATHQMEKHFKHWQHDLYKNLVAMKIIPVSSTLAEDGYDPNSKGHSFNPETTRNDLEIDSEKRERALKDAIRLFELSRSNHIKELLRDARRYNGDPKIRTKAFKFLCKDFFSPVLKNPIKAAAIGIGYAAATSYIWHRLSE